jgi:hypothetical protein
VAHRALMPDAKHDTSQYVNNIADLSHQPTRFQETLDASFCIFSSSSTIIIDYSDDGLFCPGNAQRVYTLAGNGGSAIIRSYNNGTSAIHGGRAGFDN